MIETSDSNSESAKTGRIEQKMHLIALVKYALAAQIAELEKFERERIWAAAL